MLDDAALDRLLVDLNYMYDPNVILMSLKMHDRVRWLHHCANTYTRPPRRLRKCALRRMCRHQQQERRRWV